MKRKTSSVPSVVYEYVLLPPTVEAQKVKESFEGARLHYNGLVHIDHERRGKYRSARRRLFPDFEQLEIAVASKRQALHEILETIKKAKSAGRTRSVASDQADEAKILRAELKVKSSELKTMRAAIEVVTDRVRLPKLEKDLMTAPPAQQAKMEEKIKKLRARIALIDTEVSPEMLALGEQLDNVSIVARKEATVAVKALRASLYWGTYLINEQAMQAAQSSKKDPSYRNKPAHCLVNRIGIHFGGGAVVSDLENGTLMQIRPMPTFRTRPSSGKLFARGKAARTTLRFRIGSEGTNRAPVFAEFPMIMDRPLPKDCRIKDAYIKRSPLSVRQPWRYKLCISLEHPDYLKTVLRPESAGTVAVNFGWRLMLGGDLRVCMVQTEKGNTREILIPRQLVNGFAKCDDLRGIIDEDFDATKAIMAKWMIEHGEATPEAFREAFDHVGLWKSHHRLSELVSYWRDHRIEGDLDIFTAMNEWNDRYRHLGDWERHESSYLFDWRRNFFRIEAMKLVRENNRLVMDMSDFSKLARNSKAEEKSKHGKAARRNRMIAAPGELRLSIMMAAKKYGCAVDAVQTKLNTKRCNVCGANYLWDQATKVDHKCKECGTTWDQDLNNTDNAMDKHASGVVIPMVRPEKTAKTQDPTENVAANYKDARERLAKMAKKC